MTAAPILNLTDVLFAQRSIPREGEHLTHFNDIVTCLRAVAYRRRGVQADPPTKADQTKFALGHAYEQNAAKTLREAGHDAQEGLEVSGFDLDIGHPDIVLDGEVLVETKTTISGAREPQKIGGKPNPLAGQMRGVSVHHALQASAYALALGLPRAVVQVMHYGRECEEVSHEVNPEDYRAQIEMLAREVVAFTGPDAPLPPPVPKPESVVPYDSCGYCRYSVCERNPRYVDEIPA